MAGARPSAAGSTVAVSTTPSWTVHTDDVVVVVSSSRPSSPRNTHASTPRPAKTPAITGAIRGSAQPIAWAAGRVGFVSGPRKLNVVPMPSSRRATAACRIAGWNAAEKQKVMPGLAGDLGHPRRRQVEADPERLQDVRRAGLRRRRAVAVLDHGRAGPGGHDRGHGRDVDRHRPVPAGADHVEQPAGHRDRVGRREHRVREAGDLLDGLALGPQRHGEAGDLHRGGVAGEDLAHRPGGLGGGQVLTGDQRAQDVGPGGHGQVVVSTRSTAVPARERSSATTESASRIGSIGWETVDSARDQVASQASCGRPISTRIGGHW